MTTDADRPIGIFDSGFGGLTVARAVLDQLPHERVVYLADSARQPYGPKAIADVRQYALESLDRLVAHGVKLLVIACNTASAAVLHDARERYDVPVVEVIRPAVRQAVGASRTGKVGVLSTEATKTSGAYVDAFMAAPHIEVTSIACPRFVSFVEAGVTAGDELLQVAREYLRPAAQAQVDTLVLGCTHYPLLTAVIAYVMEELTQGASCTLVSSAEATAREVFRTLAQRGLLRPDSLGTPAHVWYSTADPSEFARFARRFLGPEADDVRAAEPGSAQPGGLS